MSPRGQKAAQKGPARDWRSQVTVTTECGRMISGPLLQSPSGPATGALHRIGHHGCVALLGVRVQLDERGRLPLALTDGQQPSLELLAGEIDVSHRSRDDT